MHVTRLILLLPGLDTAAAKYGWDTAAANTDGWDTAATKDGDCEWATAYPYQ